MWRAVLLLATMSAGLTLAQFPRECVTPAGLQSGRCCPSPSAAVEVEEDECGAAAGRGRCVAIAADERRHGPQYPYAGRDDRERWPLRFFNRTCQCNGNFSGYDCGRCRHGLTGPNCDQRTSGAGREQLRRSRLLPRGPGFCHLAPLSPAAVMCLLIHPIISLQDMLGDPTFALPYWNFAIGGSECDICTDELLGARSSFDMSSISSNSVFSRWRVVCESVEDSN